MNYSRYFQIVVTCLSLLAGVPAKALTMTKAELPHWLKGQAMLDKKQEHDWSLDTFVFEVGDKTIYTEADLQGYKPPPNAGPLITKENLEKAGGWKPITMKIRSNFDDVLSAEDPSQDGKARTSDINGATFSFSRDLIADQDTWQGKGAVIFPLIWETSHNPDGSWRIDSAGFTPSISLEKLVTEGAASKETDSLVYRVGGFLNWAGPIGQNKQGRMENRVRGYFSYGTDTDQDVSIPAAELEWEPTFDWGSAFALGHWRALAWRKGYDATSADFTQSENALIAYQLRILAKAQAGEVSEAGGVPGLEEGSFMRVGPIAELKLDPLFFKNLSLTTRYQYLAAIEGPDVSPDRFEASLAWTLWHRKALNQQVSLKATYINGPLDFRDTDVESLLIGFGVTF